MAWKLSSCRKGEVQFFFGPGFLGDISEKFVGLEVERVLQPERPKRSLLWNIPSLCRACSITWIPETAMWALSRRIWSRQVVWITGSTRALKMGQRMAKVCIYPVNCIGHRARFAMRVPWGSHVTFSHLIGVHKGREGASQLCRGAIYSHVGMKCHHGEKTS